MLPAQHMGPPRPAAHSELGANVPWSSGKTVAAQIAETVSVPDGLNYLGSRGQVGTGSLAGIPERGRTIGGTPTGLVPTQFVSEVSPSSVLEGQMVRVPAATPTTVTLGFKGHVREPLAVTESPHPHRAREWAWRAANIERLRREFLDQWIVLEDEEIVAHGADPVELVNAARRRGIRVPYVFRIEEEAKPNTSFLGL